MTYNNEHKHKWLYPHSKLYNPDIIEMSEKEEDDHQLRICEGCGLTQALRSIGIPDYTWYDISFSEYEERIQKSIEIGWMAYHTYVSEHGLPKQIEAEKKDALKWLTEQLSNKSCAEEEKA